MLKKVFHLWTKAEIKWMQTDESSWMDGFQTVYGCRPCNLHWLGHFTRCHGVIGWIRHPTDAAKEVLVRRGGVGEACAEIREYASQMPR
jgi:hypothetical protein